MADHRKLLDIMAGRDTSAKGALVRTTLALAEPIYAGGTLLRSAGFRAGIKRAHALARPTVSVGNLTTGGTGKTPMVQHVARLLAAAGHRPCILLRGYKGGDEAEEHKLALGDLAIVEPNPDRVFAAREVLARQPETTCFILDDGFQHRRAKRDLDLVLLDATNPFGYDHLLPRGLMREPMSALRRADAILITRADQAEPAQLARLDNQVQRLTGQSPLAHAEHAWAGLLDAHDNDLPLNHLKGLPVMGVVGIGNPQAFARTLARHAGPVVHCEMLPDHHPYTTSQLHALADLATTAGAKALVTTQKDWVKWALLLEDRPLDLPVLRARLSLRFRDGEDDLARLLLNTLGQLA